MRGIGRRSCCGAGSCLARIRRRVALRDLGGHRNMLRRGFDLAGLPQSPMLHNPQCGDVRLISARLYPVTVKGDQRSVSVDEIPALGGGEPVPVDRREPNPQGYERGLAILEARAGTERAARLERHRPRGH